MIMGKHCISGIGYAFIYLVDLQLVKVDQSIQSP